MRAGPRHQRLVVSAVLLLAVASNCSSGPPAADRALCDGVQDMVDGLAARDVAAAFGGIDQVRGAVDETGNERLKLNGTRFLEVVDLQVDDAQVRAEDVQEVGQAALQSSAGALEGMIQECTAVGTPVRRLPSPSTSTATAR